MFFTDYMTEQSNQPGINDNMIGPFIVEALAKVAQFHIWHILCKSGQKHTVLGEFYVELQSTVDELAEIYISAGGRITSVPVQLTTEYSDDVVHTAMVNLRDKITECIVDLSAARFRSIHDELVDLQELIDKTIYKFDLE